MYVGQTGKEGNNTHDLPDNVCEYLPLLELNVMRLHDGSFTFSIFRKPYHAGTDIHAYSYQPTFQKISVIRSLYLRAYRFCDQVFLPDEELRIKQDFMKLGYTAKFIDECKLSAHKGCTNEVKKDKYACFTGTTICCKQTRNRCQEGDYSYTHIIVSSHHDEIEVKTQ